MTYQSFRVEAFLVNGIVLDSRFGIGLDSILASVIREEEKRRLNVSGEEYDGGLNRFVTPEVKTVELPLSKCVASREWHWMSTCAIPLDGHGKVTTVHDIDVRSYIQVDDSQGHESTVSQLPANISSSSGRWKLSRGITPVTFAQSVVWTGYGDVEEVSRLVSDIPSVGASRRSGVGEVRKWVVTPIDALEADSGHVGVDGKIARPSFKECLTTLKSPITIESLEQSTSGFRPPYWHIGNQAEVLYHLRK